MILTLPPIPGDNELHLKILESICGPTRGSMIDLCCYHAPTTPKLGFKERKYVDIQDRKLDDPDEQQYFELGNALEVTGHYDVALCIDGIEHFGFRDGLKLLDVMAMISDKQILFTPVGPFMYEPLTTHPDTHKSFWNPNIQEMAGYANVVLPNYHPKLDVGAFYFWKCPNLEEEFERVKKELSWIQ